MSTKFDLSTLNLSAGTHSITVIAKADGYKDSVDSEAVTYIKPYTLSGTWVFNEEISVNSEFHTDVNFACSNTGSVAMWCDMYDGYSCIFYGIYDDVGAATIAWVSDRGWVNNAYRTVYFGTTPQEVSKEFYEWFTNNATQEITDLAGTSWYVPRGWSVPAGYGRFYNIQYCEYESSSTYALTALFLGYTSPPSFETSAEDSFTNPTANVLTTFQQGQTITSAARLRFYFKGGADCTNPKLIAWLQENGKLYPNSIAYTLSKDGTYYICSGIGTATDTYIVIPSTYMGLPVKEIGESAFYKCTDLISVVIPDSVTRIGNSAFYRCDSLTSVVIGNGVTSIGSSAFSGCTVLRSITIPDSVTNIGDSAFYYCRSLTSVTIPNGVTTIEDKAFDCCHSLTSVTIPDSVTSIGAGAFSASDLTTLVIPNSVTSIGKEAFMSCSHLTSVVIPNSVTSIGEYAFIYCSSLTIFCEATSIPGGWDYNWNYSKCPVEWGYKP